MKTIVNVDEDKLLIVLQGVWGLLLWIKLVKLARYMRFMGYETTSNCDK